MSDKELPGEKLKRLRTALKLSQQQLAAKCECSHATISNLENGDRNPSAKLAKRIEVFFDGKIKCTELLYSE